MNAGMVIEVRFENPYAEFNAAVESSERHPAVLCELERLLFGQGIPYRLSDLFGAKFATLDLGWTFEDATCRAVIWHLPTLEFFEIALHGTLGRIRGGGWLLGRPPVLISDETVNAYPVLLTEYEDVPLRHEYHLGAEGYEPAFGARPAPLGAARRMARRRARHGT